MSQGLEWREKAKEAFAEAIDAVGGQESMGKLLGTTEKPIPQSTISFWLNHAEKGVPADKVIQIEEVSKKPGLRHRLRPDVYGPATHPERVI